MNLWKGLWANLISPLLNEHGQIPSSLTDNYDALLTTTLRAMQPRLHDNITRGNKFVAWLTERGRMRKQDGGERVKVALMHAQNSTADIYSGYGTLDTLKMICVKRAALRRVAGFAPRRVAPRGASASG